jgi:ABC-type polysaccharide/polyol phosphate export permease
MKTKQVCTELKPETKRLIILDIIVAFACIMQVINGISYWMLLPVLLAQLTILGYGVWLFESKLGKMVREVK